MASKRLKRKQSCIGKIKHNDRLSAMLHIKSLKDSRLEQHIKPYKCKFCKSWHIGHY